MPAPPQPPSDWSDTDAWDVYLSHSLERDQHSGREALRFAHEALRLGGRAWVPGCGVDPMPLALSAVGCNVLATDISPFSIRQQTHFAQQKPEDVFPNWTEDLVSVEGIHPAAGSLRAELHNFCKEPPPGTFDIVINARALHGLSSADKLSAAHRFRSALRPGGALILDTLNLQGRARDEVELPLQAAGFFVPFVEVERWYREQLASTGIVHAMVLGRPLIPHWNQYPEDTFAECEKRDRVILRSFSDEYETRMRAERPKVASALADPTVVVAHIVYSTG